MRQDDGVDGDAQRLSQLVWMIFLKVLDDNEQELEQLNKGYVAAVPKEFQWRTWAANEEGLTGSSLLDFVNNKLFPGLKQLPQSKANLRNEIVRGVFEDSHNYMKNGTLLRQVANKINTINFNAKSDRHSFNDIYETLLKSLQSAGNSGEYYTPRPVTEFITEMVDPQFGEAVLDPACGTGGFLANAIEHIRKQVKTPEDERVLGDSIRGVEKKQLPHLLCTTNMILHGIEVPTNIRRDNTLKRPLKDYGPADRVDVILTNPPLGGTEEPGIESNFPQAFRTRETADLFLVLIMKLLKDGGRAGIVLPDGTLFGDGVKARIKEELLDSCNLHTIVRLPPSVFAPYTNTATNLLFFSKGSPTKEIWFYEHTLPKGKKAYSKTKPIRYEEFDAERKWWNNRKENDFAWKVSIDQIRARNYNLDIKNPNKPEDVTLELNELLQDHNDKKSQLALVGTKLQEEFKRVNLQTKSEKLDYLIDNIHALVEVPGIAKLLPTYLIETAIEGQLVSQSQNEGTGDELLDQILEEREKLQLAGKLKRQKELSPVDLDDVPFNIPGSWQFTRLGEISNYGMSYKKKPNEVSPDEWLLDLEDIEKDTSTILQRMTVKERSSTSDRNAFFVGDVLYGKLRPYLNKVIVADEDGVCSTEIMPIRTYGGLLEPKFLMYVLRSSYFLGYVNKLTYGVKMPRLGTEDGRKALIPLPPRKEQKRIINELDKMLDLVSEIKAIQA
jgi:type I restriction enzyme M protein